MCYNFLGGSDEKSVPAEQDRHVSNGGVSLGSTRRPVLFFLEPPYSGTLGVDHHQQSRHWRGLPQAPYSQGLQNLQVGGVHACYDRGVGTARNRCSLGGAT